MAKGCSKSGFRKGGVNFILAFLVVFFLMIIAAVGQVMLSQSKEEVLIPTLDLVPVEATSSSPLGAALIGQQDGVNVHLFTATEATNGITVPKDEHVVFNCPASTSAGLTAVVATARLDLFADTRFWGYEYTGNEVQNKRDGRTGRNLWDGRFWLSTREKVDSGGVYDYLDTPNLIMQPNKRYYLMVDGATGAGKYFRVSCLDSDADNLNNAAEDMNGNNTVDFGETNKNDADSDDDAIMDGNELVVGANPVLLDTDGDGIQDGTEVGKTTVAAGTNPAVFVPDADAATVTNPGVADTDGDTYNDGVEDANRNGRIDPGESDPNDPNSIPTPVTCGNGMVQGAETCDDNNLTAGDGCSPTCQMETGWNCTGSPSVCTYLLPERSSSVTSASSSSAGNSTVISLSPASGAHALNADFTVDVLLSSTQEAIGGVNIFLQPSSNLEFRSASAVGSVMDLEIRLPVITNGILRIERASLTAGPFTGTNGKIVTLTFRQTSPGVSTITVDQGTSEAISVPSFTDVLTGTSGASYTAP